MRKGAHSCCLLRGQKRHINIWHINNFSVTPVTDPPGRVPGRKCLCSTPGHRSGDPWPPSRETPPHLGSHRKICLCLCAFSFLNTGFSCTLSHTHRLHRTCSSCVHICSAESPVNFFSLTFWKATQNRDLSSLLLNGANASPPRRSPRCRYTPATDGLGVKMKCRRDVAASPPKGQVSKTLSRYRWCSSYTVASHATLRH